MSGSVTYEKLGDGLFLVHVPYALKDSFKRLFVKPKWDRNAKAWTISCDERKLEEFAKAANAKEKKQLTKDELRETKSKIAQVMFDNENLENEIKNNDSLSDELSALKQKYISACARHDILDQKARRQRRELMRQLTNLLDALKETDKCSTSLNFKTANFERLDTAQDNLKSGIDALKSL